MSWIYGLIASCPDDTLARNLARMGEALAKPSRGSDHHCPSGAAGLGIVPNCRTPEDSFERQPLLAEQSGRVLVCDARIDNRLELCKLFGLESARAARLPDSAFVLMAYERWGRDCVCHLEGDFVLALWDPGERALFLARSPFAVRSLFYASLPGRFIFASRPRALFAVDFCRRELDLDDVADWLCMSHTLPGRTLYRGIKRLESGQCLTLRDSGLEVGSFYSWDNLPEPRPVRDEDCVEAFGALLTRVVADHLRSATGVSVMMSGGLDSSTIAAVAAEQLASRNERLTTYTEVPPAGFDGSVLEGRYADETPLVQAMGRFYPNLDSHYVHSGGKFFLDGIDSWLDATELPYHGASNMVWYDALLAEASRSGHRVVLMAAGGNLTINWTGDGLLPQLLRSGNFARAWTEARALARAGLSVSPLRVVLQGLMPLLPRWLWMLRQRARRGREAASRPASWLMAHSAIHPDFMRSRKFTERAAAENRHLVARPQADPRPYRVAALSVLTNIMSDVSAGFQQLHGTELRDPTSDRRLVDFCLSLPEEQFLREGERKWLVRRAMARRLPAEILENRKRGLQAAAWFQCLGRARPAVFAELDRFDRDELVRSAIDLPRLRRLVEVMDKADARQGATLLDYRGVLESGLVMGRFLLRSQKAQSFPEAQ